MRVWLRRCVGDVVVGKTPRHQILRRGLLRKKKREGGLEVVEVGGVFGEDLLAFGFGDVCEAALDELAGVWPC